MINKGGSLTIKACEIPGTDAIDGNEIRIQVIDTGQGIPEHLLPKIFQPFFTTKGTAKKDEPRGTGLGLAICKDIIEHHKGRIVVESQVGKGTTFNIYLPAGPTEKPAQSAGDAAKN
jgi:signal transduction histidine kinase